MTTSTPAQKGQEGAVALPPSAINVLAHIQRFGPSTASNGAIGEHTGVTVTAWTVKHALGRLEDLGFVTVERHRRNRHTGDTTGRTLTITAAGRQHLAQLASEAGF